MHNELNLKLFLIYYRPTDRGSFEWGYVWFLFPADFCFFLLRVEYRPKSFHRNQHLPGKKSSRKKNLCSRLPNQQTLSAEFQKAHGSSKFKFYWTLRTPGVAAILQSSFRANVRSQTSRRFLLEWIVNAFPENFQKTFTSFVYDFIFIRVFRNCRGKSKHKLPKKKLNYNRIGIITVNGDCHLSSTSSSSPSSPSSSMSPARPVCFLFCTQPTAWSAL